MDINASLYRENGKWVIVVKTEQWVIDDMLFDANRKISVPVAVIVSIDTNVYGGTIHYYSPDEFTKSIGVIEANVKFQVSKKGIVDE